MQPRLDACRDSLLRGPWQESGRLLVLAGLSVRLMAESARRAGYEVIALDAFGDRDTRQAAAAWHDIGTGQGARLDGARLLAALGALRRPAEAAGPIGWIAGTGFEALPEVLEQGAALLPLLGTAPPAQAALRDPGRFFAALTTLGLPHPAIQLQRPEPPRGWLYKDFGSSGGWQVRAAQAAPADPPPRAYYQQWAPGDPMSCLFIANGRAARVLGHQRQLVAPLGTRPCAWHGVLGPVAVAEPAGALLAQALAALVPRFGLHGLASLDYLLDGSTVRLLECNPRPSASMALYEGAAELPLIDAHVQACLRAALPGAPCLPGLVRGTHLVFADRTVRLDGDTLASLHRSGWCHDLAASPVRIG
ncbi:MAG TPA: ATP-grasp domain-containing protein, partial [Burkholderiaceae bacterium]|nr:ATP-grasp domain-containing protein [Burkholderiaceae bacterium]